MSELDLVSWPRARASDALFELARHAGYAPSNARASSGADERALVAQLESAAAEMALEAQAVEVPYIEAERFLARAAPALVRIIGPAGDERLLALAGSSTRGVRLLAPDLRCVRVPAALLRERWCAELERTLDPVIEPALDAAELRSSARARARAALAREHLAGVAVGGAWIVRLAPGAALALQARRAGLFARAVALALTSVVAGATSIGAWIVLGRGALAGHFEAGWIVAWALLLASSIPLRALEAWLQGALALRFGALFRRRLLAGAARLDPDAMRGEGAGHLLGRVLESEAFESVALGVGFQALGAVIDSGLAVWALANGPRPYALLAIFGVCVATAAALGARHLSRLRHFAAARLALTQDLVERMVGHRTRITQEDPRSWHIEEDRLLERYLADGRALDASSVRIATALPGVWLVLALALLATAIVAGAATSTALAIGIGGVLLGQQALGKLCAALTQLGTCAVAWRVVRPLFEAARVVEPVGLSAAALRADEASAAAPLIEARGVAFRHPGRERPVLDHVDLRLARGDRVLVEGRSGGGKSTLAALFAGGRTPSAGVLLASGLDRTSHGALGWRRRIAAAPQFHENHVFTGSLAFNLLLGSQNTEPGAQSATLGAQGALPGAQGAVHDAQGAVHDAHGSGRAADHARALEVCRELGLDELIARMPSGLQQIVGETGWQLSHGEKSRLYIARALLQQSDVVVLDESFAALDPHTLRRSLACAVARARALVVVAHP